MNASYLLLYYANSWMHPILWQRQHQGRRTREISLRIMQVLFIILARACPDTVSATLQAWHFIYRVIHCILFIYADRSLVEAQCVSFCYISTVYSPWTIKWSLICAQRVFGHLHVKRLTVYSFRKTPIHNRIVQNIGHPCQLPLTDIWRALLWAVRQMYSASRMIYR